MAINGFSGFGSAEQETNRKVAKIAKTKPLRFEKAVNGNADSAENFLFMGLCIRPGGV
jgi:hypothetical protein